MTLRLGLLAAALVAAPAAAQAPFPPTDSLEATLGRLVEAGRTTGVVVGLLEADGTRRFASAGTAGEGLGPLGPNSAFEIGSITKVFTGSLLADLVRTGEVGLDEPLAAFAPEGVAVPARGDRAITLRDLTTHRSGLPRLSPDFDASDAARTYATYGVEALWAALSGLALPREPGAAFEYSNYGTALLGQALAARAGVPYPALVEARLLGPLGLDDTAFEPDADLAVRLVQGHDAFGDPAPRWPMAAYAPTGGLVSTAADVLDFAAAQLDPDSTGLLGALDAARRPLADAAGLRVGMNWLTAALPERTVVWHNGGTAGFRTFLGLDEAAGRAVVVLSNAGGDGLDDLGLHLLDPGVPLAAPSADLAIAAAYQRGGLEAALARHAALVEAPEGFRVDGDELNDVGYWLVNRGSHDDAIALFRRYVEARPGEANPLDSLGDGLRAAGRYDEALEAYREAVAAAEANGDARLPFYRANLRGLEREMGR